MEALLACLVATMVAAFACLPMYLMPSLWPETLRQRVRIAIVGLWISTILQCWLMSMMVHVEW